MQTRAEMLLKEWCDTLLSYQVKTGTPYTNNALLCPACHVIHGRIADLCFPLTVLWSKTNDFKYLKQADKLIDWSEYNLKNEHGIWYNDVGNRWFGTSAFSAMSMGEALYHFGDVLPIEYKNKWLKLFLRMADVFMSMDVNRKFHPVTNYYCGIATLLAMAWKLTGDNRYYEKSKFWISNVLDRFDKDGLLYGEGYPMETDFGCHTIDMGYNLEESLPLLLRYADITGEHMDFFRERLRDHLAFLLPDGAIDNSFGSRHNKWTYWGSRTSDGLIEGLALVLDDPMFANACEKVLSLYEHCTHNGLLQMPMAHEVGEPTCLHHTFTHAKALAALICAKNITEQREALPFENIRKVKAYQSDRLVLVSNGLFRATFSATDSRYLPDHTANAGGSLNLLYHKNYGVICAATSADYIPTEPLNQQYLRSADNSPCMTAQFVVNGKMGCLNSNVTLNINDTKITASSPEWQASYNINKTSVDINLNCQNGIYNLPIVCKKKSIVTVSDDNRSINIDQRLTIESDTPLTVDCNKRIFHQVGGLLYLPISVSVQGNVKLTINA
jgi:hypothetical protein